jgi:WD40 repeat protein
MIKYYINLFCVIIILVIPTIITAQVVRIIPPIGHTAQITDVDISSDGKYIVSSSVDKTLILWDYASGREIVQFSGTDYGVTCCTFDDKNWCIYSGGWDGIIRKWDLNELKQTDQWQAYSNGVNNIELLPEASKMASIGKDGILKIWKCSDGALLKEIKISDFACDAISSSDKNNLLAVGDQGGNLIIIDTKSFDIIRKIKLHDSFITSISFSENGKILATGSYDYKIKVIETKAFNELFEFGDSHQMWTETSLSANAEKLSAISLNGILYEWNLESGELVFKKTTGFQMGTALTYSNDANDIVACGSSNSISVYRSGEGVQIKSYIGFTSPIEGLDVTSDRFMLSSVHWDSRLRLFDMYKCHLSNSAFLNSSILSDVIIAKNSNEIMVSSFGAELKIYDYKKNLITDYYKQSSGINAISLTDDEKHFAIASKDSLVTVFNVYDRKEILQIKHNADVMDVCFSHNGEYIYSVGRDSILNICNINTPFSITKIKLKSKAESVAITSDDKFIAVGLWTGEVALFDMDVLKLQKYIKPHKWIVSDLCFSPKNNYLVTVSWDKKVILTDWQNEIETAVYFGHTGSVTSVKYSDDGKYVVTGGWDNQVKILDSRNLEEICSVIPVDEEDYLIITPDMYYMGTSDAAKKVCFASGLQTYSFEQFDLQYNRPDKVIESLPFADKGLIPIYKKAYEKRLIKTGFNKDFFDNNFNAPQINISNINELELYTDKNSIEIEMLASDSIYYIDRYKVFVNGVSIFGINGKSTRKDDKNVISIREKIKLCEGLNHIEVSAINTAGVESFRQSVEIYFSPEIKIKKNIYIISMAVAEYNNTDYNLNYTINDGRAIVNAFTKLSPEYNVIVDTLFGKDCTRDNFSNLKNKLNLTNVDDIVIIHFSGHGLLDSDGGFYFATYDVNFENPSEKGLEYDLIESVMDGIPARNKLILIDACHSGELDTNLENSNVSRQDVSAAAQNALAAKGVVMYNIPISENMENVENSFDLMMNYFADVRKGTGAVIISAATGSGFALEIQKLEHGVFTYVLLQGLLEKLADENDDGEITVSELREYIFDNVMELSDGYQKPTTRKDNLINDFVIYK